MNKANIELIHNNSSKYSLRKIILLITKIGGLAVLLSLLVLLYFNIQYPKIVNYYLDENIAFSAQYHTALWDEEDSFPLDISQLKNRTPYEIFNNSIHNQNNLDKLKNNFGILIVSNENLLTPIYFIESKYDNLVFDTDMNYKRIDSWYVFCNDEEALNKVKYYDGNYKKPHKKIFEFPDIYVSANWYLLKDSPFVLSSLSRYMPFDINDEFVESLILHSTELMPKTILWGDIKENRIKLKGYSNTGASYVLPVSNKHDQQIVSIPNDENSLIISIDEPIERFSMFNDNAKQLNHLYGLTLNNYFNLPEYLPLLLENPIRRISIAYNSPLDPPVISIWLDKNYDYETLLEYLSKSKLTKREYTLPDGSHGSEFVHTNYEIEINEEGIYSIGDFVYYVNHKDLIDNMLLTISTQPLPEIVDYIQIDSNNDFLQIPIHVNPDEKVIVSIESTTNFDDIEHVIDIK